MRLASLDKPLFPAVAYALSSPSTDSLLSSINRPLQLFTFPVLVRQRLRGCAPWQQRGMTCRCAFGGAVGCCINPAVHGICVVATSRGKLARLSFKPTKLTQPALFCTCVLQGLLLATLDRLEAVEGAAAATDKSTDVLQEKVWGQGMHHVSSSRRFCDGLKPF